MGRDDWYRRSSWTQTDAAEFAARLKRSRGADSKAQYARIQALYLEQAGLLDPAQALLDQVLAEWPSKFELASVYLQKATCALKQGAVDGALWWLRKAIQAEQEFPNVKTQAFLEFAKLVVRAQRTELYAEAANLLAERAEEIMFPIDRYYSEAALAVFAAKEGRADAARRHAVAALEASQQDSSGLQYHPNLGIVTPRHQTTSAERPALIRGLTLV